MTAIDPDNPPANIVYVQDGATWCSGNGWRLSDERSYVQFLRDPISGRHAGHRPMCIVRLKAWK